MKPKYILPKQRWLLTWAWSGLFPTSPQTEIINEHPEAWFSRVTSKNCPVTIIFAMEVPFES